MAYNVDVHAPLPAPVRASHADGVRLQGNDTMSGHVTNPVSRNQLWRKQLLLLAAFGLLALASTAAHAATAYRCQAVRGTTTWQDTPCAAAADGRKVELPAQPLIGASGEAATHRAAEASASRSRFQHSRHPRERRPNTRVARAKPPMSWECRAADGEVFYRHTRCPASVPGDGVVRGDGMLASRGRSRRGGAWGRIAVHGSKIPRAEACRRIHAVGAATRDGHAHDENVSVYDHLMGRDPCSGS